MQDCAKRRSREKSKAATRQSEHAGCVMARVIDYDGTQQANSQTPHEHANRQLHDLISSG
jgi:hypothetical protein